MIKWYKKIKSNAAKVLGINERNLRLVYPLNPRQHFKMANDKVLSKKILQEHKIPVAKLLMTVDSIGNINTAWDEVPKQDCAIKPANGSGGGGILILDVDDNGQWTKGERLIEEHLIHQHLANIIFGIYSFGSDDEVLVEEKIIPHSFTKEIYPIGVPDLRIIMKENEILMGMMRVPTNKSDGKANLHQGAIGIGVDLSNGQLKKVFNGEKHLDHHPDTKFPVTGVQIPYWDKVIEICNKVARAFPLDYLGIDIAFDEYKGPLVLEINARPGLEIQNVNEQGLKEIIEA